MASDEILRLVLVVAVFLPFGRCQLTVMTDGDTQSCESKCLAAYPSTASNDKTMELSACRKGCRLMSIIDFVEEESTSEVLSTTCEKACNTAYVSRDNSAACELGCQSELPTVEARRKQIQSYYDEEAPYLNPMIPIHAHFNRIMDCMMDHVRHEMTMAMMFLSPSGRHGQVVMIHAQPMVKAAGNNLPEAKTSSNFLETNLVLADSGATPDIKRSQIMASSSEADFAESDGRRSDGDWLTCLAAKVGLSRTSLLFVLVMIFIGILWLFISSMTTSSKPIESDVHPSQKLNIYGDGEFLEPISLKTYFSHFKPQEPSVMAPPLPVKISIEKI